MKLDNSGEYGWRESLRLITPILIFIVGLYVASIDRKIETMSQQIFHHLTNDDLHMPRSIGVTKAELSIYQEMREEQMKDLRDAIKELSSLVKIHILDTRDSSNGRN